MKSSYGTAMKLFDRRHPRASVAMAVATALAVWATPSTKTFVDGISSRDLWAGLNQRLLPQQSWFGLVDARRGLAEAPQGTSPITTGALPDGSADAKAPVTPAQ